MNFLELNENDLELYDIMKKQNGEAVVSDLYLNSENAKNIIEFFKNIGINNINDLLVYEIDIFLMDFQNIQESFRNIDIKEAVTSINNDFFTIENYIN